MRFGTLLLLLTLGCGGSSKTETTQLTQKPDPIIIPDPKPVGEGQFLALLKPLNDFVTGQINGAFTWSKEDDEVVADLRFNGGAATADVIHAQNVHVGSRCPMEGDDLNLDGYIDAVEGEKVYGKILVPLDDDINNQLMGQGIFPLADNFGTYIYSRVGSYQKIMDDLTEEDLNPEDPFAKLEGESRLNLEGKVVVVYGVSHTTIIPFSVRSNNRLANFQTLPIACGVIKAVKNLPGTSHRDISDLPPPPGGRRDGSSGGDDGATIIIPPRVVTNQR